MNEVLRATMLAQAEACVNALTLWTQGHPDADLDQREEQVLQEGRKLMAALLTTVAAAGEPRSPGCCPQCQQWTINPTVRQRPRTVLSRCGLLRIPRQMFTCGHCGHSWRPLDKVLKLKPRQRMSNGVLQWLVQLGAEVPFRAAARLLEVLTGLGVGAETVRCYTEQMGQALEEAQQRAISQVERTREPAEAVEPAPGQLVVQTDGLMLRFLDGWHEVKLALVAGLKMGRLMQVSYLAARESAERFGPRLLAEGGRRGALQVQAWQSQLWGPGLAVLRKVVILGDGAAWIWNLAAEHFGERIEIVDFYHASQHLWNAAKALYGEGTAQTASWANERIKELLEHGAGPVLQALEQARADTLEAAQVLRQERGYFRANAQRMNYPQFREQGLPIGSGPIESAAKHLVQIRMKRPGMRWSVPGGQAILTLRAHLASRRPLPKAA